MDTTTAVSLSILCYRHVAVGSVQMKMRPWRARDCFIQTKSRATSPAKGGIGLVCLQGKETMLPTNSGMGVREGTISGHCSQLQS